jgi:hypothetical protein
MPRSPNVLPLQPHCRRSPARAVRPSAASAPFSPHHRHHLLHYHGSRCVAMALVRHSSLRSLHAQHRHRQRGLSVLRRPAHGLRTITATVGSFSSVAPRGKRTALSGREEQRYRCAMARQTANQHGPALEAPAGENVVQSLSAAARGGSELVPRRAWRMQGTVIPAPVAAAPHPRPGGPATVRPNPSVKPTHSGLRPPRAAYLNRWAAQSDVRWHIRRMAFTSARIAPALARWHPVGMRSARRPSVALASTPRLTFRAGCPSFGGQRTDFCPRTTPWPCATSQPFVAHGRACAQPSARAVRPLAASEPVFAHHRHHLSTSTYRAMWRHRPVKKLSPSLAA